MVTIEAIAFLNEIIPQNYSVIITNFLTTINPPTLTDNPPSSHNLRAPLALTPILLTLILLSPDSIHCLLYLVTESFISNG